MNDHPKTDHKSRLPRSSFLAVLAVVTLLASTSAGAAERDFTDLRNFPAVSEKVVILDVDTLDLKLRAADVRQIDITTDLHIGGVKEEWADDWLLRHTPKFDDQTDKLVVTAKAGRGRFMWFGHLTAKARLDVVTPRTVVPDLTTVDGAISVRGDFPIAKPVLLRTSSGNIDFSGAAHSLDVRTTSGDTRIEVVRPIEKLVARNSTGDVTLTGGAREVQADTSSGTIWLGNLSGSVRIVSSDGKVTLRWDRLDPQHTVHIRTSSGRIHLAIPGSARPRGSLKSAEGSIRSDFPGVVAESGDTVELKGDGPVFDVETATGEIILTQADG